MTPNQKVAALRLALQAILGAVKEAGDLGAPGGVLYAALIGRISLQRFEQIMTALVRAGKLRRAGDLYFWVADLQLTVHCDPCKLLFLLSVCVPYAEIVA